MLKAKGSIFWNFTQSKWEIAAFGDPIKILEPGDTIVVPEKIERIAWLRNIKDISTILMNIAVIAGVTKSLYKD